MRRLEGVAIAATLLSLACAGPGRAEGPVLTLGSSLGVDVLSEGYGSVLVASTSPGGAFGPAIVEPGLRLGLAFPSRHAEVALGVGASVIAGGGEFWSSSGFVLDANYVARGTGNVSPYLGAHAGASTLGEPGAGGALTNVGGQLGVRALVCSGHGAIRCEARASRIADASGWSVNDVGLRLGYELWFR